MIKFENIEVGGFYAAFRGLRNPMQSHYLSDSKFGIGSYRYGNEDEWEVTESWVKKDKPDIEDFTPEFEEDFEKYNKWLLENGILKNNVSEEVFEYVFIGPKDMNLAKRMVLAGTDEAKFARMIHVQMDITAPFSFWKQYATYKVATVENSESTMHKILSYPITKENFSWEDCSDLELIDPTGNPNWLFEAHIENCEQMRQLALKCLEDADKTEDLELKKELRKKSKRYWVALIDMLPDSWMQKRTVDFNYQTARAMYFARKNHKLVEWSGEEGFCEMLKTLPYAKELIIIEKEK